MGGIKNKLNNKLSNKTLFSNLGSPARGAGSRRLTEGLSHRWGRYAKYLAISCLTLALISTISLNLYRTYSNSSIEASAVGNSSSGGELHHLLRLPVAMMPISPFRYLREVALPPVDTPSQ